MTIRISVNVTEAARMFKGWQKQVPYALSQALNGTVLAAQGQLRKDLRKRFIIRTNWVSKGLQARFATKRDLAAVIGSKDPFMAQQELGGQKTAQGQGMAIPIGPGGASPALRGAGLRGKTLQSRWPSKMPSTFNIRTHEGQDLILQRTERYKSVKGKGKGKNKGFSIVRDDRVRVIYRLKKTVKIKAKWGMRLSVALTAGDVLGKLFAIELASALKGAR